MVLVSGRVRVVVFVPDTVRVVVSCVVSVEEVRPYRVIWIVLSLAVKVIVVRTVIRLVGVVVKVLDDVFVTVCVSWLAAPLRVAIAPTHALLGVTVAPTLAVPIDDTIFVMKPFAAKLKFTPSSRLKPFVGDEREGPPPEP